MRWPMFALAFAISMCGVPAAGAAALCGTLQNWPGGTSADVVFTGISAVESGVRGDGPNNPMPVSLNADVLGLGEELSVSGGGLVTQGRVICVRYRPEWLGLMLSNSSAAAAGGTLKINFAGGSHLEAELPELMPGEVRQLLVMSGREISAIAGDAFEIVPKHR